MSVGSKLALLVLILPIILILIAFTVVIYYFGSSLDAKAILDVTSTVISLVLVDLLVWERLRDSLSKKLRYLHKNVLYKLYNDFGYRNYLFYTQENSKRHAGEIQCKRDDLEMHGKFLGLISLYPPQLLARIDEFLALHTTFYRKFQEVRGLAEKKLGISLNRQEGGILWQELGFESETPSGFDPDQEKPYRETAKKLLKEQPLLITETKNLHETLKEETKKIYEKLEAFFKRNTLRLEPEPTFQGYSPYG